MGINEIVEMYKDTMFSLDNAMADSGGSFESIKNRLGVITAQQLICDVMCANGIRFHHISRDIEDTIDLYRSPSLREDTSALKNLLKKFLKSTEEAMIKGDGSMWLRLDPRTHSLILSAKEILEK